jgi:hypothetical protein
MNRQKPWTSPAGPGPGHDERCQAEARAQGRHRTETPGKQEWRRPRYSLVKIFSLLLRTLSFIRSQDSIANGALVIVRLQRATGPRPVGRKAHNAGPGRLGPGPAGGPARKVKGHGGVRRSAAEGGRGLAGEKKTKHCRLRPHRFTKHIMSESESISKSTRRGYYFFITAGHCRSRRRQVAVGRGRSRQVAAGGGMSFHH